MRRRNDDFPGRRKLYRSRNGLALGVCRGLADYLGLLRQIAPAAEAGAKDYLASFEQRCGRPLTSIELRRAMSQGDGDPVLMGLIRASHLRDATAREQLAGQIRCPIRGAR